LSPAPARYGHCAVIWAKTAEPIEVPFGLWASMGLRNHVLDGSPEVLKDVAMATTFWLSIGNNFGCMIASDTLFDSRGRFSGSSYPMKTADFDILRDVAIATVFWLSLYGVHVGATWRI